MGERNALDRVLRSISRRMRLARMLSEISFAIAASAGVALLYQIVASAMQWVGRFGASAALATAVLAIVWARALWRLSRPVGEDAAADIADERGELRDLLKSARWFEREPPGDGVKQGVVARAGCAAQTLDPKALAPLAWPRSAPIALVLAGAALSWFVVKPDWPRRVAHEAHARVLASDASADVGRHGTGPARYAAARGEAESSGTEKGATVRADGPIVRAQTPSATAAGQAAGSGGGGASASGTASMERRPGSTAGAEEGQGGEASTREADAPKGAPPTGQGGRRADIAADDGVSLPAAKKLVATGALDLFSKIGEMFKGDDEDAAQSHGEVARALRQATLLGDRKDDVAESPRQNANSPKAKENETSPPGPAGPAVPLTPDSQRQAGHGDGSGDKPEGNARLDAGDIPQQPSATGEGEVNRFGGNDNAESKGTGPAAPVKGEKTARLATQLNRSVIKSVASEGGREVGLDPIYAATRSQQSMLDYRTVATKSPVGREEAMNGERVPMAWRPVVRDYFIAVKSHDKP